MKRQRWLLVAATLAAAGCADDIETVPEGPAFTAVYEGFLQSKCTFACHSGGEFAAGGLDMTADPHGVLVNALPEAPACAGHPMKLIAPGEPEQSLLYLKIMAKIEGTAAPCGDVMPPGADVPALSNDEAEMVRAWIEAGALDD